MSGSNLARFAERIKEDDTFRMAPKLGCIVLALVEVAKAARYSIDTRDARLEKFYPALNALDAALKEQV